MGIFKRLKIRTKLIILITLMLFGLFSVGVFGVRSYVTAVYSLEELYTKNLIAIEELSDARAQSRGNYSNI